jgi:hypothetical protein
VIKIFRIGLLQKMVCIVAHIRGMLSVLSDQLWIGGLWFGFLFPFLSKLLTWLAMRDALSTGRKLLGWGFQGDVKCFFFADLGLKIEIIYSSLVGLVAEFGKMSWGYMVHVLNPPTSWDDVVSLGLHEWKGKTIKAYICRLVFDSSIYNIWRTRNALRHGNNP